MTCKQCSNNGGHGALLKILTSVVFVLSVFFLFIFAMLEIDHARQALYQKSIPNACDLYIPLGR